MKTEYHKDAAKGFAAIAGIIALVSGIVGLVILDDVFKPTLNVYTITNESVTLLNNTAVSLGNDNLISGTVTVRNATITLAETTNYTMDYAAGTITLTVASDKYDNNAFDISYGHHKDEYWNSSLSRVIAPYVVPVGLLGILAFAAFLFV